MDWREGEVRQLALSEFDERFARYRLQVDGPTRQAMIGSLRRFGQLSPVVICELGGSVVLVDGFKRHEAAGEMKGLDRLSARRIAADEASAKAAMYSLNCLVRRMHELEEAWIVQALVREDGLTQLQAAQLLGRHKSWACRRLAMLEKLSEEVRSDLALGLVSPTVARQLVRLPVGNQAETLAVVHREDLKESELRVVVDLILAAKSREQVEFVLKKPRQALRQASGEMVRGYDPRLSAAGNRIARRLAMLLDHLSRMETWLEYDGRTELTAGDRPILEPGFERLARDALGVSDSARELAVEFQK